MDLYGIPNEAINPANAILVSAYGNDSTMPMLVAFDLDLNTGLLTLSFNEAVNTSTLLLSDITLQDERAANNGIYRLTGSSVTINALQNRAVIDVLVGEVDLNAIKLMPLCYDNQSCYIRHSPSLVTDVSGLPVYPHVDGNALIISTFTPDTTPPLLTEFVLLNLSSNELILRFNETVDINSFNVTGLRLQSLFQDPISNYSLINSTVTSSSGSEITIQLSDQDIMVVQQDEHLCTMRGNCYAWVDSTLVQDSEGNPLTTSSNMGNGRIVTEFVEDTEPPCLTDFILNFNDDTITLIFNEPVNPTTLNPTVITLQSAINVTEDSQRYTLTGGSTNSESSSSIVIELSTEDLSSLKLLPDLATSQNNTYIAVTSSLIEDMSFLPNSNKPVINGEAHQCYDSDCRSC